MMETVIRDVRLAVRSLVRSPAFSVVAVLCLALGIGADSAVFSIVDTVLLRPLPYADPDGVVMVYDQFLAKDIERGVVSGYEFFDVRDRNESFDQVAAVTPRYLNLTGDGEPERLVGVRASASLFPLLGVEPTLGRTFTAEEDTYGKNDVVVLSHRLWKRRFGGSPDAIGRKMILDGRPFTVIGVLPKDFRFGGIDFEAWIPLASNLNNLPPRNARGLTLVARLSDGVSLEQAQQDMDRLAQRMQEQYPDVYPEGSGWGLQVVTALEDLVGNVRPALFALFGAVALVLLIACANVANLLLARATAREKEVAIRTALGAGRWRLVRQLLAEGLVLSFAGAALGLLIAWWGPKLLIAVNPARIPRLSEVHLDPTVLLFTAGVAVLTGVIFGLVPAMRPITPTLGQVLKEGGKTSAGGSRGAKVRSALVVVEVAIALVVLLGAALLVQSFLQLRRVDPGFRTEGILTFRVFLSPVSYPDPAQRAGIAHNLTERLEALPGVDSVGVVSHLPLGPLDTIGEIEVEGRAVRPEEGNPATGWRMVSPGYFRTMGIPVEVGRAFRPSDDAGSSGVVILARALADRLYPDQSPLGRRLALLRFDGSKDWRTVVGVVGDVRHSSLGEKGHDQLYVPYAQYPFPVASLVLATSLEPEALSGSVRSVVHDLEPDLPVLDLQPMDAYVAASISDQRLNAILFGLFAVVALILAVAGVYGVMAYSVARQTREIGVRMALGADRGDVVRMILRRTLLLGVVGLVIGLGAALGLVRWIESMLYGVPAFDVWTYLGGALVLCLLTVLAGWIPAWRATRIHPAVSLRYE